MDYKKIIFLTWNVRGLNAKDKMIMVKDTISSIVPDFTCLQESKIKEVNLDFYKEIFTSNLNYYSTLESKGASGGILMAWNKNIFSLIQETKDIHSSIVVLKCNWDNTIIKITGVYGPQVETEKIAFLEELTSISTKDNYPWLLNGDFNLTLSNNERTNYSKKTTR